MSPPIKFERGPDGGLRYPPGGMKWVSVPCWLCSGRFYYEAEKEVPAPPHICAQCSQIDALGRRSLRCDKCGGRIHVTQAPAIGPLQDQPSECQVCAQGVNRKNLRRTVLLGPDSTPAQNARLDWAFRALFLKYNISVVDPLTGEVAEGWAPSDGDWIQLAVAQAIEHKEPGFQLIPLITDAETASATAGGALKKKIRRWEIKLEASKIYFFKSIKHKRHLKRSLYTAGPAPTIFSCIQQAMKSDSVLTNTPVNSMRKQISPLLTTKSEIREFSRLSNHPLYRYALRSHQAFARVLEFARGMNDWTRRR